MKEFKIKPPPWSVKLLKLRLKDTIYLKSINYLIL